MSTPRTDRPLHIAFVVSAFPLPSETFITLQIAGLLERGHEVTILATTFPGPSEAAPPEVARFGMVARTRYAEPIPRGWLRRAMSAAGLLSEGLGKDARATLRALDARTFGRHAYSLALLHEAVPLLPARRYDIIHAHFGSAALRALRWRDVGAISGPLLSTFHGHDVNQLPRLQGPGLYRELFARGERFTANTEYTAGKARRLGCPADRIDIVPMGIDLERVEPRIVPRPPGGPRVLSVGRLVEKKGLAYALETVAAVRPRFPDIEHILVGDGPLGPELRARAAALGITANVSFLGARPADEVRRLMARTDVFLLPCVTAADGDEEGQALVLQEAQAAGVPVVATVHNGLPEGVADGVTGYLVAERDTAALANRLTELLSDPERRARFGDAGRAFVAGKYDARALLMTLESSYLRAIRR